ncbi:mitochondrial intermembrane space translocase subunit [Xylariomycetidae sp. FL2044]|nr:mitochondrial intermembrane space translocase subunit [Xylariomycetidae sp. FL2044]
MDGLTAAETKVLEQRMAKRQMKEFVGLFSNLVDHCFSSCVDDFSTKSLTARESGCVSRCVQKAMATNLRLGERFQEHNMQMSQAQQK